MSIGPKQPEIRFNCIGPMSLAGVSYEPKVMFLRKTVTTATENDDFWVAPAGTFIVSAFAVCSNACDANTEISLGTDGSTTALFNTTNFSVETLGNFYMSNTALYLPSGDTMRLTIAGTPVAGEVQVAISYFELAAMAERGFHFDR